MKTEQIKKLAESFLWLFFGARQRFVALHWFIFSPAGTQWTQGLGVARWYAAVPAKKKQQFVVISDDTPVVGLYLGMKEHADA